MHYFQADSELLKDKDDFAVVLQTATEHLQMPKNRFNSTDLSYLASDCFHLSQKGYARCKNITIFCQFNIFLLIIIHQVERKIKYLKINRPNNIYYLSSIIYLIDNHEVYNGLCPICYLSIFQKTRLISIIFKDFPNSTTMQIRVLFHNIIRNIIYVYTY